MANNLYTLLLYGGRNMKIMKLIIINIK